MTCPLYSVFHVVLSTQSLPACGETSHHTSLGAVALTAPRSLLRFTSQTSCRLRQRVRHGAPLGTLLRVLPGRAARSQSNSSRSGKDDRLIMRQALALTTSACSWSDISTVRKTNSAPKTSASKLPTC